MKTAIFIIIIASLLSGLPAYAQKGGTGKPFCGVVNMHPPPPESRYPENGGTARLIDDNGIITIIVTVIYQDGTASYQKLIKQ
jgi:hypothetical protein